MKLNLLLVFTFLSSICSNASYIDDSFSTIKPDSISKWKEKNNLQLIFTQNSFINWSSGGNNSISGIVKVHSTRNYKNEHLVWNNELKSSYGLNKEEKRELRKTEDKLEITSTFGYRRNPQSNWYNSAKFNFSTQFANGYKYPNKDKPISKLFAPAYMFLGVGSEFFSKKLDLKLYLSPITNKTTFVFSQPLANEGAFGVERALYNDAGELIKEGKNTRMEFGNLVTCEWEKKVMSNIDMENKLTLYSDYLNNYGNVDVNWELNFDLTINKYVTANIGTHLRYDHDIKTKEDINNDGILETTGPKVQLKQLLGVGFSYNF
ncbi:DUF3078 domain-containing protein [Lutibacter citreus]|uniref:DUF3078 domain-containing protein n=1 Tax=Lutibacter citreus TaxID=2138210 RepID=UPI000DBE820A|nr:DUF3078 domain-containing protein [Lutibacter citreus]